MEELGRYSDELKAEAVKMANEQGLTQSEVAKRLSIPKATIGQRMALSKAVGKSAKPGDQSVTEGLQRIAIRCFIAF